MRATRRRGPSERSTSPRISSASPSTRRASGRRCTSARRMTRSLDLLSSATAGVAAGAFREPIAIQSRDEIGALARSFNSMASQLRQMEETKREFFATVSHELRSPLTSIRGAADLLRDGVPGPLTEKQERLMDIVAQSSERLLRLVNQILDMSRLRAGLVELDRKPLDFV